MGDINIEEFVKFININCGLIKYSNFSDCFINDDNEKYCYITFLYKESYNKAMLLTGFNYNGFLLRIEDAYLSENPSFVNS